MFSFIKIYFAINKITKEKIDLIEKGTHLNMSEFRKKLENKDIK